MSHTNDLDLTRRALFASAGSAILITATPRSAHAAEDDLAAARIDLFGDRSVQEGRVIVELPPIAENGHSVPIRVQVDSPMTATDYVKRVAILSPRNPLPVIGVFALSPQSGRAEIATRIRMSGTQSIEAVAEMNDGTLWRGSMETVVTLAACVVL
ncbi:MAG: thiosulfate oxidation carrier protein SoxY [Pseudomonadota bacterium]